MAPVRRLHIGGTVRKEGWEIYNIMPSESVDHVGDARDLSCFGENTFVELYASHVLEHFNYVGEIGSALAEWKRVLAPGGRIYISVPNLEVVCKMFASENNLSFDDKFKLMRIIYGGQMDAHDYHKAGFFPELLSRYLLMLGFENISEVEYFDIFKDSSTIKCNGINISLNMFADKPLGDRV